MKKLTESEERLMHILWKIKRGFVKDVMEHYEDPKPAYTTISSIIRILEKKGFIGHRVYGPTYEYYPRIEKDEYKRRYLRTIVADYFDNSYKQLVSFFASEKKLKKKDLVEIMKILNEDHE